MSQSKIVASFTIRPALLEKLDCIAHACGTSRSELVGRLLGTMADDLLNPLTAWVQVKRESLMNTLKL